MDLGTALLNAFVVLAVGTALGYLTNDRFKALRREMDAFRTSVGASIADLHAEIVRLETRLETRLDSGLNSVRADLTPVARGGGEEEDGAGLSDARAPALRARRFRTSRRADRRSARAWPRQDR
jgi:hypothetical protein